MAKKKLKSGLTIISIDHYLIEGIIQGNSLIPITEALQAHDLDKIAPQRRDTSPPIAEILKWYKYEKLLTRKNIRAVCAYSLFVPIFAYSFYQDNPTFLYLVLLILSLPICAIGAFCLFLINKKGRFSEKLQEFCKHPFICLIDDKLFENIPEMYALEIEQQNIAKRIQQSTDIEQKIDSLLEQIQEKSNQMGEKAPVDICDELYREKQQQQNLREKARLLLADIKAKHHELKQLQAQIHNRADLEWLQAQARAITGDRVATFSQRALADLEVDTVDLHHRIDDLHHDLELAAQKWDT